MKPCSKNQRGEGEGGKGDGDESGEYEEKLGIRISLDIQLVNQ